MKKIIKIILFFIVSYFLFVLFRPMSGYSYIPPWSLKSTIQAAQNGNAWAFFELKQYNEDWLKYDNDAMVQFISEYIDQYSRYCVALNKRLKSYNKPDKQQILERYEEYCVRLKDSCDNPKRSEMLPCSAE
ncbi:MAG: hypothetical protein LBG67_03945 [Campylobacteraceae bacterium]|nr:hypothetical protein [Campylobacteraceae bacterium]